MNQELENTIRQHFDEFVQHLIAGDAQASAKFDTGSFQRYLISKGVATTTATCVALLSRWRCQRATVMVDGQYTTVWEYRVIARG